MIERTANSGDASSLDFEDPGCFHLEAEGSKQFTSSSESLRAAQQEPQTGKSLPFSELSSY